MVQRRGYSIRHDDSPVLTWVVLLVIGAALLSGWLVASRLDYGGSRPHGLTVLRSWFGGPVTRPRLGFQPAPAPDVAPALGVAEGAAAGASEGQLVASAAPVIAPVGQASPAQAESTPPRSDRLESGQAAVIANTEGVGVVLRSEPRENARVPRGLLEGTHVTVLEHSGDTWVHVRAENGLEGWIPSTYLQPAR